MNFTGRILLNNFSTRFNINLKHAELFRKRRFEVLLNIFLVKAEYLY
jgi:hypothetical protein